MSSIKAGLNVLTKRHKKIIERRSTGIKDLDELLEGGFPNHCGVLLLGPPGCGKSVFCRQFLWAGLKNGEIGVYIAYDHSPDDIRDSMASFGWDVTPYEEKGTFAIIDCYNGPLGIKSGEKYYVESPLNVDEFIYITDKCVIEKAQLVGPDGKVRVAFDSGSPITNVLKLAGLFKTSKRFQMYLKKYNVVGLHVTHQGMQNKIIETFLRQAVDGAIEFDKRIENDMMNYYLWISKMPMTAHSRRVQRYVIDKNGISIVKKKHSE